MLRGRVHVTVARRRIKLLLYSTLQRPLWQLVVGPCSHGEVSPRVYKQGSNSIREA
jgi:hypothetical protein